MTKVVVSADRAKLRSVHEHLTQAKKSFVCDGGFRVELREDAELEAREGLSGEVGWTGRP